MNSKNKSNSKRNRSASASVNAESHGGAPESKAVSTSFSLPESEFKDFKSFRDECRKTISVNGSELIRALLIKTIENRNFEEIKSAVEEIERLSVGKRKTRSLPNYSEITNEQWKELKKILVQKKIRTTAKGPGRLLSRDFRSLLNGVFYQLRTECKWRNVPEKYGHWQSVLRTYHHLKNQSVLTLILDYYFDRLKNAQIDEKESAFRQIPM